MTKRFLAAIIALLIFVTGSPVVMAHEYEDIPADSMYYYPIHYLRRNDVFMDTPTFNPDIIISRAEFIKYLVLLNSPEFRHTRTADLPFEDTRNNAWYASYFEEAIDLGILDARKPKAEPDKKLTVIDALTLLFHSQSIPIPNVYKGLIPYTDVKRNTQAAPLIMRALQLEIIYPMRKDYVGIYQRVTRAQAARMIYKMDLATLGGPSDNGLSPAISSHAPELEKIISVWELIDATYLNRSELDHSAISDSVLKQLLESLEDPYSVYMDTDENMDFTDAIDGQIEGIGAVIGYDENEEVTIVSPIKGSPADEAGLRPKDIIVGVDGVDTEGMTLEEVVNLIKGPRGTTVELRVRRSGRTLTFTIERDLIEIPSLEYEIVGNGTIMHMMMSQFNVKAGTEFDEAVQVIQNDSDIRGLIIDLRGNPGGLLDQCVKVLGHFVEAQEELVAINYADYTQVLLSRGTAELHDYPTIVLIDKGSASASEIVAGTLQDYGLATIMGETSFGKGTVQEVSYFMDNSSVKLTVAEWETPGRQNIEEDGVTPDIQVLDDPDTEVDEALERAMTELSRQL